MYLKSAIDDSRSRNLGTLHIINDGESRDPAVGNYIVRQYSVDGRVVREGRVDNWRRKDKSPMQLLGAAMRSIGHG
jgi:hypothetical protein